MANSSVNAKDKSSVRSKSQKHRDERNKQESEPKVPKVKSDSVEVAKDELEVVEDVKEVEPKVPKIDLKKKLKYLDDIRRDIKKKRIFFDENKERFGLDALSQLVKVKNTSEVKGYPFKGSKGAYEKTTRGIRLGLKVVPIETKYDKNEHPCNLENIVLKELTERVVNGGISPHVAYYLGTQKVLNKSKALKMLNLKRLEVEEKIRTHSNMLISEFVEGGSLDNWVYNTYEDDGEISDGQWRNIVFQLVYTIAVMQHYYRMMHNDFHYGNILIDDSLKPGGYFVYQIRGKTYYIRNTGTIPKLWDFEFSMVYSDKIKDAYPNKFIIGPYEYDKRNHKTIIDPKRVDETEDPEDLNVPYNYNEVYDVHYFLTSLLDLYISQELFDWIIGLYPREVIPEDDESTNSSSTSDSDSYSSTSSSSSSFTLSSSSSNSKKLSEQELNDRVKDLNISDSERSDRKQGKRSDSEQGKRSERSDSDSERSDSDSEHSDSGFSTEKMYVSEGRLLNGTEDLFKLPTPIDLLDDPFFDTFTRRPDDFDESTAVYFNAGF